MSFSSIQDILQDLRDGRMIVLIDDENRENEGDLVCAAQFVTPEIVNFMTQVARGVLCVAMSPSNCDRLKLEQQTQVNTAQLATAFTVTVDAHAKYGITTGVSAQDRATTIKLLADPNTNPMDFSRPGHINPLRARKGGVLVRTGQTEGSVDLCHLAGLEDAAVIIEIMNEDGSMARLPELKQLCDEHDIKMCTVDDIIAYRMGQQKLVQRLDEAPFHTEFGEFHLIAYQSAVDRLPHLALCKGRVGKQEILEPVLTRVQAQNLLGDVFFDVNTPSSDALKQSMQMIQEAGEGAIVYMRQESIGSGIDKLLSTMHLSEETHTVDDMRVGPPRQSTKTTNIGIGAQILRDLGLHNLKLITGSPNKFHGLSGFGLDIADYIPLKAKDKA
ncbi:MAG: 3,4-dihydroxy-2-butanone-4-phosphate synthase [Planctomycetota bacterium]